MVDSGCDVIEIGLPYSDPVMDGPTIQAAAQRALEGGFRTRDVLRTVEAVAATGTPTLVMTYWNPVERYGVERFARDLANAGGAGLITPGPHARLRGGVDRRRRRARPRQGLPGRPSSTDERLRYTAEACRGFVYATAVMGVTGARATTSDLAGPLVERTRAVTDLPIGVGLGVSNGDQAAEVASYADAVIVGSAFVRVLLDADDPAERAQGARPRSPRTSPPGYAVARALARSCSSSLVLAGCGCVPGRRRPGRHGRLTASDDDGYHGVLLTSRTTSRTSPSPTPTASRSTWPRRTSARWSSSATPTAPTSARS